MTEFAADVALEDIVVRDTSVASAVEEPIRAIVLDMLADREMSVAGVHEVVSERGYDRTENTIRHHINELRDAGLIEVARLAERRGGTTKFYRANTIVLSYAIPDGADPQLDAMAERIRPAVSEILDTLQAEYDDVIDDITAEMGPCEHCQTQKYETYVLLTALRRAFVRAHTHTDE